jgi:non-specific serine/threonine protein kinase
VFALLEESLARFRAHGDKRGMAHALLQLGWAAPLRGDPQAAVPLLRTAEALFRELGLHEDVAWTLWGLGNMAQLQGDYAAAEAFYTQALAIVRELHDPSTVAQALATETLGGQLLAGLGSVALLQGDLNSAEAYLREGVLVYSQINDLATCVMHLAGVALGRGDGTRAARLLGAAEGLWGSMDSGILPAYRPIYAHICTDLTRRVGERTFDSMRLRGRRMRLSKVIAYALGAEENLNEESPLKDLTPREREVALLAARGLTNREIAKALVLAEGTARVHVEHVLAKLDLHSRAQLAAWAIDRGVLSSSG